jgi:hypothetical protein
MALSLVNIANVSDSIQVSLDGASNAASASFNGKTFVYVPGTLENGLTTFELDADGFLILRDNLVDNATTHLDQANVATVFSGDQLFLLTTGFNDDGVSVFAALLNNQLGNTDNVLDTDAVGLELNGPNAIATTIFDGIPFVFVAGQNDNGISYFALSNDGQLSNQFNVPDDATLQLNGADALATATFGNTTYLFAGGFSDDGISVFSLSETTLSNVDNVNDADNAALELDGVVSLATALVGSKTFLFAAGFNDNGISVFDVATDGTLTNVDNVGDNATLKLFGVGSVQTAKIAGTTYLFATSATDDGVSVFAVAADGSLINVANVSDDATLELNGASSVTTAVVGGKTFLVVTGLFDDGVSSFRIDVTGNTINGTIGNDIIDATHAPAGELLPSDLGDIITGGLGKDIMSGGLGNDKFNFDSIAESVKGANRDVIEDFRHKQRDHIDLAGIDAKNGVGGNQKFTFIGTQHFDHHKGELHFVRHAGFVIVEGDVNGDGRADFQVQVDHVATLGKGDFIL